MTGKNYPKIVEDSTKAVLKVDLLSLLSEGRSANFRVFQVALSVIQDYVQKTTLETIVSLNGGFTAKTTLLLYAAAPSS